MFMAGIIPGVMIYCLFIAYVIGLGAVNKKWLFEDGQIPNQPFERISWREKFVATKRAIWGLLAPVIVLGGIYTGIFTPTESAAALVIYALIVCVGIKRTVSWRSFLQSARSGAESTSMILCILATAFIFALVVSQLQMAAGLLRFAETAELGAQGVSLIIFVTLFILGMLMNPSSMTVITLPVSYPLAMSVGINGLWLGIFYQILCEMAALTPPFGLDLFIIKKGMTGTSMTTTVKGVAPFLLMMILSIVIIYVFPQLVTWLPKTMK